MPDPETFEKTDAHRLALKVTLEEIRSKQTVANYARITALTALFTNDTL